MSLILDEIDERRRTVLVDCVSSADSGEVQRAKCIADHVSRIR